MNRKMQIVIACHWCGESHVDKEATECHKCGEAGWLHYLGRQRYKWVFPDADRDTNAALERTLAKRNKVHENALIEKYGYMAPSIMS